MPPPFKHQEYPSVAPDTQGDTQPVYQPVAPSVPPSIAQPVAQPDAQPLNQPVTQSVPQTVAQSDISQLSFEELKDYIATLHAELVSHADDGSDASSETLRDTSPPESESDDESDDSSDDLPDPDLGTDVHSSTKTAYRQRKKTAYSQRKKLFKGALQMGFDAYEAVHWEFEGGSKKVDGVEVKEYKEVEEGDQGNAPLAADQIQTYEGERLPDNVPGDVVGEAIVEEAAVIVDDAKEQEVHDDAAQSTLPAQGLQTTPSVHTTEKRSTTGGNADKDDAAQFFDIDLAVQLFDLDLATEPGVADKAAGSTSLAEDHHDTLSTRITKERITTEGDATHFYDLDEATEPGVEDYITEDDAVFMDPVRTQSSPVREDEEQVGVEGGATNDDFVSMPIVSTQSEPVREGEEQAQMEAPTSGPPPTGTYFRWMIGSVEVETLRRGTGTLINQATTQSTSADEQETEDQAAGRTKVPLYGHHVAPGERFVWRIGSIDVETLRLRRRFDGVICVLVGMPAEYGYDDDDDMES
jgi:hypothetical protein